MNRKRNELKNMTWSFEENCTKKLKTLECHIEKHRKKSLWRQWIKFFLNLRKASSQIFVEIMWSNFHQHRPRFVEMRGCERHTDRHTDTHTNTHWRTDRGRPRSTYSVLKWLNIKTPTKIFDITIEINETTIDESISKSSLSFINFDQYHFASFHQNVWNVSLLFKKKCYWWQNDMRL